MSDLISHVSDDQFEAQVLKSDEPVLVDFWAEWCAPCKAIAPLLDEMAQAYAGRLRIAKLDVQNNPKTARAYGIRNIPTLMIFKGGKVVDTTFGTRTKAQLTEMLDKAV